MTPAPAVRAAARRGHPCPGGVRTVSFQVTPLSVPCPRWRSDMSSPVSGRRPSAPLEARMPRPAAIGEMVHYFSHGTPLRSPEAVTRPPAPGTWDALRVPQVY